MLFPYLFDVEKHGIACTSLSYSDVFPVIRDIIETLDMPERFNKEEHIEAGEKGELFYAYVYEGPPGTFDFINWNDLEKASKSSAF
jgi:hypothetical protein